MTSNGQWNVEKVAGFKRIVWPPSVPRLALTAMEAPTALGVSDDFFRQHIADELKWVRRGRKKLVGVRELEAWLDREAARTLGEDRR